MQIKSLTSFAQLLDTDDRGYHRLFQEPCARDVQDYIHVLSRSEPSLRGLMRDSSHNISYYDIYETRKPGELRRNGFGNDKTCWRLTGDSARDPGPG